MAIRNTARFRRWSTRPLTADGPLAPAATIDVHVPDYQLTTNEDGQQLVNIPGGLMLLEAGQYQIPYWSVSQTYPKGQQVQSVTMTTRGGLLTATGLNIPTVTTAIDCVTCAANQAARRRRLVSGAGQAISLDDRAEPRWQHDAGDRGLSHVLQLADDRPAVLSGL